MYKQVSLSNSTPEEIQAQIDIRKARMASHANTYIFGKLIEHGLKGESVKTSELVSYTQETNRMTNCRISHMKRIHGVDVRNMNSNMNEEAKYRVFGFTVPQKRKKRAKKKIIKLEPSTPRTMNALIEKVFCGDWECAV